MDKEALLAIFDATDGNNWRRNEEWVGSFKPIGEWYGVTTDDDGRVTALHLSTNRLSGELPPELGNLTKLQRLSLSQNQLSGIPPELGNLANLKQLDLVKSELSEIPPELGNLVNLKHLYIQENELSEIPPELGNLANLESLQLQENQLREIPPELGNLANLESLQLQEKSVARDTAGVGKPRQSAKTVFKPKSVERGDTAGVGKPR